MSEPDVTHGDLAALADGRLVGKRRAEVERAVRTSTELSSALAEQQQISRLLRENGAQAPEELHASIRQMLPHAPSRRRRPAFTAPRFAAAAVAMVAAAVLAVVLAAGGPPTRLRIPDVASLAVRPALAGPAIGGPGERLQVKSVDGVDYPYWGDRFGWRAVGARTDSLGGRTVTTVFYANAGGLRIGYSIVAGPALAAVGGSSRAAGGTRFRIVNGSVLTWTRAGHTCVLSGAGVSAARLLTLASSRTRALVSL